MLAEFAAGEAYDPGLVYLAADGTPDAQLAGRNGTAVLARHKGATLPYDSAQALEHLPVAHLVIVGGEASIPRTQRNAAIVAAEK